VPRGTAADLWSTGEAKAIVAGLGSASFVAQDPSVQPTSVTGDSSYVVRFTLTAASPSRTVYYGAGRNGDAEFAAAVNAAGAATASAVLIRICLPVHGERFDLMKPGKHILINVPRGESEHNTLLRVQADARRLGGQCADLYFQELNITGSWAEAKQAGGYHHSVSARVVETPGWVLFGTVELKVVHGRTGKGLDYLNFFVKDLGRAGFAVGGLLGEDDHQDVTTPPASCRKLASLSNKAVTGQLAAAN